MNRLEGKVAIVTGAGSGIGAATAGLFAEEGATVVIADIATERAEAVAGELRSRGGEALAFTVDVSQETQVQALVAAAMERYGRLDVMHNNAALTGEAMGPDHRVTEMTVELWDRVMAVNLRGPMLGCKHAIPAMLESGGGSIINTSSSHSLAGRLIHTAYGASKAALNNLTLYVATQFGRERIRCNAVVPGVTDTPAIRVMSEKELGFIKANILTPYLGEPLDIARTVLFLASDEAKYITGQLICVNGGSTSHSPDYGFTMMSSSQ